MRVDTSPAWCLPSDFLANDEAMDPIRSNSLKIPSHPFSHLFSSQLHSRYGNLSYYITGDGLGSLLFAN
jgi:hypothetical protein